jgi:hypothetical protein
MMPSAPAPAGALLSGLDIARLVPACINDAYYELRRIDSGHDNRRLGVILVVQVGETGIRNTRCNGCPISRARGQ